MFTKATDVLPSSPRVSFCYVALNGRAAGGAGW